MEVHPDAEIEVYAIWFNMLPADSREGWPEKLLTDPRVIHYWDQDKVVGTWYGENVTENKQGHVEWDAYFLYREGSVWAEDGPTEMESWGRTIVGTRGQLQSDLESLIETR